MWAETQGRPEPTAAGQSSATKRHSTVEAKSLTIMTGTPVTMMWRCSMKPYKAITTMKMLGLMLCVLGICFGVVALSITYIYWLVSPVGLPCHSASYDGTLDIENRFIGKEAFFLSDGFSIPLVGKSILLAGGGGTFSRAISDDVVRRIASWDAHASGILWPRDRTGEVR